LGPKASLLLFSHRFFRLPVQIRTQRNRSTNLRHSPRLAGMRHLVQSRSKKGTPARIIVRGGTKIPLVYCRLNARRTAVLFSTRSPFSSVGSKRH
jgi:hypothetical protein